MAAAKMSTKTVWLITAGLRTDDAPRYHDGALKDQPRRFNGLRRLVPGITQRMLTLQLRALEQDGVAARTVRVPPRVESSFMRKGLTLGLILDAMEAMG
jgi:DNA-binding HxlR family transcriptional regulator